MTHIGATKKYNRHVLPVSNGGSDLFLTYLRAQKELDARVWSENAFWWVLFFSEIFMKKNQF